MAYVSCKVKIPLRWESQKSQVTECKDEHKPSLHTVRTMSNSSGDGTKLPDNGNIQGRSQATYSKKSVDGCFVVTWCVIVAIAAFTILNSCSAFGVLDLRPSCLSNNSSADHQKDTNCSGQFLWDIEVRALKLQLSETTLQMDSLRLQVLQMQAEANKTASMVSSLTEQEKQMMEQQSAVLNEVEAVKLIVSNIYAEQNKTASVVSSWMKQAETLKFNVSTLDEKESQTAAKIFILMEQKDALSVNVFKLNSTMSLLQQQSSDLQSKMEDLMLQVKNITDGRPHASSNQHAAEEPRTSRSNQRVADYKTIVAVAFIALLALSL